MRHISDYVCTPALLRVVGEPLLADLFIYFPANNSIILYREKGVVLTPEDGQKLDKVPPGNILIERSERGKSLLAASKKFTETLSNGELNTEASKTFASTMLASLDVNLPKASPDSSTSESVELLNNLSEIVEDMISGLKKTPSVEAYERAIKSMRKSADPLTAHQQQVSTIAVMMLMALGPGSSDEVADLGTAGLVHDIGLTGVPRQIAEKHWFGEDADMIPSEKLLYLRHVENGLAMLRTKKTALTEGTIRIIEHHHENCDGSGFKRLTKGAIYRPARVLRIADELIGAMSNMKAQLGFKQALDLLVKRNTEAYEGIFDHQLLLALQGGT
jgi:HD-GYP domain-containing protein (c-di-GMP phosphodiesterase class II)